MTVERDQDIAEYQATFVGGAVFINLHDEQAMLLGLASTLSLGQLYELAADAQVAALNEALLRQRLCYAPGGSGGDSKGCAVYQASRCNAYHLSSRVDRPST